MKNNNIIIRILQIITAIAAISVIALGLIFFNVISFIPKDTKSAVDPSQKIKRPVSQGGSAYEKLIQDGDNAVYYGKFDIAIAAYQNAAQSQPKEYLPYEKIGDAYFMQKKYDAALENWKVAESLNPTNISLQADQVRSLIGKRKILDAQIKINKIKSPTQESFYYLGLISAFFNEQDKAKDALTKSIDAGDDETIKLNAQKILRIYRDFDLTRDGKIEYLQTALAYAFDQIGQYGLAIELAFGAIKNKHDYRDAWIVLGHSFLSEWKWQDAEDAFNKVIDLDYTSAIAYFFRGMAKRNLNLSTKTREAIMDFDTALKLGWQPKILAKQQMADSYFDLLDYEKAYPLYKEIVLSDPSDINRFVRPIALAINHLKKQKEALTLAKKASETHPSTAMAENLLGWAALANNDFGGAHKYLEDAVKHDPELPAVYLNLGMLAETEKNMPEAIKNYKKAVELSDEYGDNSVGKTATQRYNAIINSTQGTSDTQSVIIQPPATPSLSLE